MYACFYVWRKNAKLLRPETVFANFNNLCCLHTEFLFIIMWRELLWVLFYCCSQNVIHYNFISEYYCQNKQIVLFSSFKEVQTIFAVLNNLCCLHYKSPIHNHVTWVSEGAFYCSVHKMVNITISEVVKVTVKLTNCLFQQF